MVAWEALLARHLEGLPAARQKGRARELMVAGFREECWARTQLTHRTAFAWRGHREAAEALDPPGQIEEQDAAMRAPSAARKPLTALAKVIG
tara:strand:- start:4131 stop:4406 length:276 start_codon:yes stop_codon:yes gene_type:complete